MEGKGSPSYHIHSYFLVEKDCIQKEVFLKSIFYSQINLILDSSHGVAQNQKSSSKEYLHLEYTLRYFEGKFIWEGVFLKCKKKECRMSKISVFISYMF